MPKIDDSFDPAEYATVAERIALFYERFPSGRIVTRLVAHSDTEVVFSAAVFRTNEDAKPAATGWASERFGDGLINSVACLENTETSAVGRALANLGLTASRQRPSREEMEKAARARETIPEKPMRHAPGRLTRKAHNAVRAEHSELQRIANQITDVIQLVGEAERAGMPAPRAEELRARAKTPGSREDLDRLERGLRRWLRGREDIPRRGDRETEPFPDKPPF